MNRKMRAKKNNAEARAKRDRPISGVVFAEQRSGTEVNRLILPTGQSVPVLLDHDSKTFESLPEKEEMN